VEVIPEDKWSGRGAIASAAVAACPHGEWLLFVAFDASYARS
jgi:hypothetical protein